MAFIKIAMAALVLGTGAAVGWAADAPKGKDYLTLADPQPTESGKKVEVLEFFSYNCPRCYALDPALAGWVKAQGDRIVFRRVPVAFRDSDTALQKLYYTLEALGKTGELHNKVFKAIQVEHQALGRTELMADLAVKLGIDRQKFLDVYNSFSVQSKQMRTGNVMSAYKVDARPLIAIDGRYETSPYMLAANMPAKPESEYISAMLNVMSTLVDKSRKN